MKKLLIPLITLTLFSCQPSHANTRTDISIDNNRIKVKQNGVTKDYGTVTRVKENYKGDIEIYTNKNYNSPAVKMKRNGDMETQEFRNSEKRVCTYNCDFSDEDEE